MAYTVLARRYRSQTFDDVIGQDSVAQTLKNAIESGRVAHAYLFTGTRGVGKTTMARILAKSLNCLKADGPTVKPCLKCDSCVSVNAGEDIDVIEIDGASNTGVDNIRQLRENAIYRPARARYKIYIIDEIHMLSTGAFNALLKILEEPPDHVKFIFATTEPNKVLPTIQSRCQRFDFNNIHPSVIGEQLEKILKKEKIAFEKDVILRLSRLANGSMRDGLSLLDQLISATTDKLTVRLLEEFLGEPSSEMIYDLIHRIGDQDAAGVLAAADQLLQHGRTSIQIVDALMDYMRDLMVVKTAPENKELVILTDQERKTALAIAEKFDTPAMVYAIATLEKLRWSIKNSESPRTLLEAVLLRLALSEHFVSVTHLLSQFASGGKSSAPAGPDARSVKKKPIVAVDSPTRRSRTSSSSPAEPLQPVISGWVNVQSIQEHWEKIVAAISHQNGNTANYLGKGNPSDYSNNILSIGFAKADQFARQMCEKRSREIENLLGGAIAGNIRVRFTETDETKPEPAPRVPGARISSEVRNKILGEPAVQMLLQGLDAKCTDIEEIESSE